MTRSFNNYPSLLDFWINNGYLASIKVPLCIVNEAEIAYKIGTIRRSKQLNSNVIVLANTITF